MIAVSVSRVQATDNELADAEDFAERKLNEQVAIIAEDLLGELLQSRMKLAEAAECDSIASEHQGVRRCLSVNGPFTAKERSRTQAARSSLLHKTLLPARRRRGYSNGSELHGQPTNGLGVPLGSFVGSVESFHRARTQKVSVLTDFNYRASLVDSRVNLEEGANADLRSVDTQQTDESDEEAAGHEQSSKGKHKAMFKHVKAAFWSSFGMLIYCVIGGLLVYLIEAPHEAEGRLYKQHGHDEFVDSLLERLALNESAKAYSEVSRLIEGFELQMMESLRSTVPDGEPTWTFIRSWFFSLTVVTAIGYGNYTPVTQLGRVWVMVFGMLGIPLVVLNSMRFGKLFTQLTIVARNRILQWLRNHCNKKHKNPEDESKENEADTEEDYMPPWVAATLLPSYCALMAAVFCTWEPWSYFDSFYFTFVTLAGIGLGDIAPSREEVMMLFTVFMLIGLGLFTMFMEMGAMQFNRLGFALRKLVGLDVLKAKWSAVIASKSVRTTASSTSRSKDFQADAHSITSRV